MKRVLLAAAVAAAFGAAGPAVLAQALESPAPAPAVGATESAPAARAKSERRFRLPSERVEARLAYLRTALKITDAQQPQWESFANVLRQHARDMDERIKERRAKGPHARGSRPSLTAVERLERTQQRMQERSAKLGEVIAAAKPLYAALSAEQKEVADQMLSRHGRGKHRGGHRGGHRHMHRGA